ncbi:P-loop containing nucleoside triphosphate hydrolase protein [Baffinella frigidus]|nr:P-loop containing nucleoside triphosphate hydrolase protein [Cryptophyta sp. CCMP2293]|mmetsp:Transcript_62351/g.148532  ORF Transcript_62351/g.148532 Transcript_62351/m.148532 type:complete len:430 (+) Transcript_62351:66-1355(+)
MSTINEKIQAIELEMARTQKNKATEGHFGVMKAKIAKLRTQLLEPAAGQANAGTGFDVVKYGDSRVAIIGFPSVGKSTALAQLTGTESEAAAYEFTTLTCIPGIIHYKGTKIQLLDLPGIIEGAASGKGRGRQVIAVAKSADLILMFLDATKPDAHRAALEKELETTGIRLNRPPPDIYFRKKKTGGLKFNSMVTLTKLGANPEDTVKKVLAEYRIHNIEIVMREDCGVDDIIDLVEGNRRFIKCLYCYNKIDQVTMEEVEVLASQPNSLVVSCHSDFNMDRLLSKMWEMLALVRVYTRRRGEAPDLEEPSILTSARGGVSVKTLCAHLHKDLIKEFKYALCWGQSTKHAPQRVGKDHILMDEDIVQVFKKTAKEYGMEKKGKVLTKQGCLADPKKEVDKAPHKGPSSNKHDGGKAKNSGKMGKSSGFA